MSKALIIAEKPSVARDIVAALGGFTRSPSAPPQMSVWESDQYICTHAIGHLLELYEPEDYDPKLKQWRFADLPISPASFLLKPKSETAPLLRQMKHLCRRPDVTEIINACDAAREGELIFREIVQYLLSDKATSRVWLQSLTTESIREAFQTRKPSHDYSGLGNAAFARSHGDWLIGMNLSRALTLKLSRASEGGVWSIGRVQTPTLSLLVEREFQILSHAEQAYWQLKATFKDGDYAYQGTWFDPGFKPSEQKPEARANRIPIVSQIQALKLKLEVNSSAHAQETRRTREQKAPLLFSLTGLQKHMSQKHKWTAKKTLDIAQKCYETYKVITYPRTESEVLPKDYEEKVQNILESLCITVPWKDLAKNLLETSLQNRERIFDPQGVSDHFAIIPTGHISHNLPKDEALLFDVIVRRFLAAFMPTAHIDSVERITVVKGESFKTGPEEHVRILGWQSAWVLEPNSQRRKSKLDLPPLSQKPMVLTHLTESMEHTTPPPRMSEAQLLSLMEHAGRSVSDEEMSRVLKETGGLGTAATRADIIENLKQKDYIFPDLQPTVKGLHVIRFLKLARAEHLLSATLTAHQESNLQKIEKAAISKDLFLGEVLDSVKKSLVSIQAFDLEQSFQYAPTLANCPRCQGSVKERMWNYACTAISAEGSHCGFVIPKDVDGRWLDPPSLTRILTDAGKGQILDGFPKSAKNPSAKRMLRITRGQLEILDELGQPLPDLIHTNDTRSSARRRVTLGSCPIHPTDECLVVETKNAIMCEQRLRSLREGKMDAVGIQLPKAICKKNLKLEDIHAFLEKGRTRIIEDFESKGGKKFSAALIRNPAGGWQFEFH